MVKEYFIFYLESTAEETKEELNRLAEEGWELVCSYAYHNAYLIMERDKKPKCKVCGK